MSGTLIPNQVRSNGIEPRVLALTFNPNSTSDPVTFVIPGNIAVVTRTGVGAYRVRFAAGVWTSTARVFARLCNFSSSTANGLRTYTGVTTFNADGTTDLTIQAVDAAGAAIELNPNSNSIISVWIGIDEAGANT